MSIPELPWSGRGDRCVAKKHSVYPEHSKGWRSAARASKVEGRSEEEGGVAGGEGLSPVWEGRAGERQVQEEETQCAVLQEREIP